jgi:hypothetical protein
MARAFMRSIQAPYCQPRLVFDLRIRYSSPLSERAVMERRGAGLHVSARQNRCRRFIETKNAAKIVSYRKREAARGGHHAIG